MQNYIVIVSQSPERAKVSQRLAERASGSCKDPKKARGSLGEIYLKLFSFDWSLSLSLALSDSLSLRLFLDHPGLLFSPLWFPLALTRLLGLSPALWIALVLSGLLFVSPGFVLWLPLALAGSVCGTHWPAWAFLDPTGSFWPSSAHKAHSSLAKSLLCSSALSSPGYSIRKDYYRKEDGLKYTA